MKLSNRWQRTLLIVGLTAMVAGVLDPLEGSIVILAGVALVMVGALLGRSRHRRLIAWSFALVAIGVGALWGMSALGGVGGSTGRSPWWLLILLPYPVGWVMGLIGGFQRLREHAAAPA